jgi:hypothetical protein
VAEVAHAGEDQLLHSRELATITVLLAAYETNETCLSISELFGALDPLDLIANLLDRVDETPYVAGDVVKKMDFGHGEPGLWHTLYGTQPGAMPQVQGGKHSLCQGGYHQK